MQIYFEHLRDLPPFILTFSFRTCILGPSIDGATDGNDQSEWWCGERVGVRRAPHRRKALHTARSALPEAVAAKLVDDRGFAVEYRDHREAIAAITTAAGIQI
jgi:hypothetical protein